MNFNEALICVELVIESNSVPLIVGESGIGKTSLIKSIGKKNNYHVINIDGNMLKEGEIGGLPTIEDYTEVINGKPVKLKRTVYAVHTKLQEISKVLRSSPEKTILLFIDEINRCEHSVQQELMSIILNREINGFIIPPQVKVVAAMNPSSKYTEYSDSEYGVVDMDSAQEDRFVWIEMESDVKDWLGWGMENINDDVLSFISSFPDYLHTPYSKEMVKATPRSWERVSRAYDVYLKNKDKYPEKIFYNVVKGNVGAGIAQEFIAFAGNKKDPLITMDEIFASGKVQTEIVDRIKKESHSKLYLLANNVFRYLKNSENKDIDVGIFSQLLQYYPSDLKLAIMKELKSVYEDGIYKDFLRRDDFIEGYFKTYSDIER